MTKWLGIFARVTIGLVFIVAGVAKTVDLNFFYYQLKAFPLGLSNPMVLWLARAFIALEMFSCVSTFPSPFGLRRHT